jgi:hypothetical protein
MRTIEMQAYKFSELNDTAKQKALDKCREWQTDDRWWEYVYDDAKEIGKIMGIDIERIYFSGFYSQGDGACFEGHYEYVKGATKNVQQYAPMDTELHAIAQVLQNIQRANFYQLKASVKHRGHYYHENSTDINVDRYDGCELSRDAEEIVTECLKDFMRWIYSTLEKEYEWLTSDEYVAEMIEANDYEFDEDGNII